MLGLNFFIFGVLGVKECRKKFGRVSVGIKIFRILILFADAFIAILIVLMTLRYVITFPQP